MTDYDTDEDGHLIEDEQEDSNDFVEDLTFRG